ncbi:MAG: class I tRNA ligase family protein, partial [Patescibacteria group bacterium]
MHKKFDHKTLEKKWQEDWKHSGIYPVGERDTTKEKEYVLVEWPYPSGNLHIGHWFAFAVVDIYVRAKRMQIKQVLFPIGFDAFGLPAENAAIKRNIDPKQWTTENIAYMKTQLESMGNAFSWDKTTSSIDPAYYEWTQWMFTQFFEKGIAYRGKGIVNWCPSCNTVLANEQVTADACERCGTKVEKREMDEWKIRITDYADRLVDDLAPLDWPEHIKEAQRNWIARSEGAEIDFTIDFKLNPKNNEWRGEDGKPAHVTVFTTRPDTLFGATYLVLAPEHPWVTGALKYQREVFQNADAVEAYVREASQKEEKDRLNTNKEKTGVKLEG